MRKLLGIILTVAMLATALSAVCFTTTVGAASSGTVFTENFEDGNYDGWTAFEGGTLAVQSASKHGGSKALLMTERPNTWTTPAYNLYAAMKAAGAGLYTLHAWVYTDDDALTGAQILMRGKDVASMPSFMSDNGGNAFVSSKAKAVPQSTWTELTIDFIVTAADVEADVTAGSSLFNFCIDGFAVDFELYLDDVTVTVQEAPTPRPGQPAYQFTMAGNYVTKTDTYVMLEPVKADVMTGTTAKLNVKNIGTNPITVYLSIRKNDLKWSHAIDSAKVTIQPGKVGVLSIASVPADGVHPVLELDKVTANDKFIIGNFTNWELEFTVSPGVLVPENIDGTGIFAPAATKRPVNNGGEGTADPMVLGYAIAAISGLGALIVAKKRISK